MMHYSLPKVYRLLVGMVLCALCSPVLAEAGGLALGFVRQGDHLDRVSITALAQAPAASADTRRRWMMTARTEKGVQLWQWPVSVPRSFHTGVDARSEFVLSLPAVPANTRLTLLDQRNRPLWSERIQHADLIQAQHNHAKHSERVDRARDATARLDSTKRGSALSRQLASIDLARGRSVIAARSPLQALAPALTEQVSTPPPNSHVSRPELPLSSASVDILRAQSETVVATTAGSVPVVVSVVDENGNPPASAFPAYFYRDGNFLGQFIFNASGQATLPLESGGQYELSFLPLAPLVAERQSFGYSGDALPPFVLKFGWLLDVHLQDSVGTPLDGSHQTNLIGQLALVGRFFPATPLAVPGAVRFALPKDASWSYYFDATPANGAYSSAYYIVGRISGDQQISLRLAEASPIAGAVRAVDGGALGSGGSVYCSIHRGANGIGYSTSAPIMNDGNFEFQLPLGMPTSCTIFVPAPMLGRVIRRTFQIGDFLEVDLLRGVPVRFLVQDQDGQHVAANLDGRWDDAATESGASCSQNPCELLMPSDRAATMRFRFYEGDYVPVQVPPQVYQANSEHIVVTRVLRNVSGHVANAEPNAEYSVRVRVYDDADRFVISSLGSDFEFRLPDGRYRFEADHNSPFPFPDTQWTFRQTVSSALVQVQGDVVLPDLPLPMPRGEMEFVVDRPCWLDDQSVHIGMTTPDGRRIERMSRQLDGVPIPPRPPGQCASVHTLGLSPGDYVIDIAPLGWLPQRISTSVFAGQTQQHALMFTAANRTQIWRGRLADAQQLPPALAALAVYDGDQSVTAWVTADAQGRFEVPFVPGWSVEAMLFEVQGDSSVRANLKFGSTPPGPIWQLDDIALGLLPEFGLRRLYGNGDRHQRINILFVAEGFTDASESFTDTNGNGIWDGIVWYDLNASGVLEWQHDHVGLYGNVQFPPEGSVPTAQNEPFVDLNDDGILSLDDPALFVANTRAFMRSLLGSDLWNQHRDAFNAWLMFAPSAQAGHDVLDQSGGILIDRDTLYDGALSLNGYILQVNTAAVTAEALTALPEVDLVVTILNEPIFGGRANASTGAPGFMIVPGGLLQNDINSAVQSHEMGHFVGALCDEYSLNAGIHPGALDPGYDLGCSNVTLEVDADRVPWADLLPFPPEPLPTRHQNGSIGLYEGGSYVFSGAYRPSMDSTMRNTKPFFNAPSRRILIEALEAHTNAGNLIFSSGFE